MKLKIDVKFEDENDTFAYDQLINNYGLNSLLVNNLQNIILSLSFSVFLALFPFNKIIPLYLHMNSYLFICFTQVITFFFLSKKRNFIKHAQKQLYQKNKEVNPLTKSQSQLKKVSALPTDGQPHYRFFYTKQNHRKQLIFR